jgi:hypothetical protein
MPQVHGALVGKEVLWHRLKDISGRKSNRLSHLMYVAIWLWLVVSGIRTNLVAVLAVATMSGLLDYH